MSHKTMVKKMREEEKLLNELRQAELVVIEAAKDIADLLNKDRETGEWARLCNAFDHLNSLRSDKK